MARAGRNLVALAFAAVLCLPLPVRAEPAGETCRTVLVGERDNTEVALKALGLAGSAVVLLASRDAAPVIRLAEGVAFGTEVVSWLRSTFRNGEKVPICVQNAPAIASGVAPVLVVGQAPPDQVSDLLRDLRNNRALVSGNAVGLAPASRVALGGLALHPLPPTAPAPPTFAAVAARASVSGTVRKAGAGQPIAGALAKLVGPLPDTSSVRLAVSDSAGAFNFHALPPGAYLLSAGAPGYAAGNTRLDLTAGQARSADIVLATSYPCDFSLVNRTGWTIETSYGTPPAAMPGPVLPPFGTFVVKGVTAPRDLHPEAFFRDHAPLVWDPVIVGCGGADTASIMPPPGP